MRRQRIDTSDHLRVLWVMKELAVGGAERLLLEIAPELADDVLFIPAVVFEEPRTFEATYHDAGFDPVILGSRSHADARWIHRLRALVREIGPDVVHAHLPYVGAMVRMGLVGLAVPQVYTEHSLWHRYRPATRAANALTYGANEAVIWVSDAVRRSAKPIGSPKLGSLVIHNGVAVDRVALDARGAKNDQRMLPPRSFGTVGHLMVEKGIDVLLAAATIVHREVPDASGYVVGIGKDARRLDERRRATDAPVAFLGLRQDARGLIDDLDVFVMPSRAEGLPVALLEAMALSKPIVATRVGGIPEALTDGESALLVDPDDAEGLSVAIVRLLEEPDLAQRLGCRANEVVRERFSSEGTARAYLNVYRSVLAGKRIS